MRRDISVSAERQAGTRVYRIKDPLSLKYFQLSEEEYFIWLHLDNESTTTGPADLLELFHARFPGRQLSAGELNQFVQGLMKNGLVQTDSTGTSQRFVESHQRRTRSAVVNQLSNLLAIRLPGFNPSKFLDWLCPRTNWLFNRVVVSTAAVLIPMAFALFALRAMAVSPVMFQLQSLLSPENLLWLSCALALTKIAHELGHAVACRRAGAECHEMGVMLLAMTPCLYCDVTDAWTIPSKWKRIGVSAAGMVVDLVLAAISGVVWSFTEPGLLNSICLNIVVVCSVSTLIFNGNPLMRYDGYYILADFVEVPNLRQVARGWSRHVVVKWLTGIELLRQRDQPVRGRTWLFAYGVASSLYMVVVIVSILVVARTVLGQFGLTPIADIVTALTIFRMLIVPLVQSAVAFASYGRQQMNWNRTLIRGGVVAGLLFAAVMIPLPHRLNVDATVLPHNASFIFPPAAGVLSNFAIPGEAVATGDRLVELSDPQLDVAVARVAALRDRQQQRVAGLENRQFDDSMAAAELPGAMERLASLNEELRQRQADRDRLVIDSPISGVVFSTASHSATRSVVNDSRQSVKPEPLFDDANRGAFVSVDTLLCVVGESDRWEAVLTVDQDSVGYFQPQLPVKVRLSQTGLQTIEGVVADVSKDDAQLDRFSFNKKKLDDPSQLAKARYQVRVSLAGSPQLLLGDAGTATVTVAPTPLFSRLCDYLGRTIRFRI